MPVTASISLARGLEQLISQVSQGPGDRDLVPDLGNARGAHTSGCGLLLPRRAGHPSRAVLVVGPRRIKKLVQQKELLDAERSAPNRGPRRRAAAGYVGTQ